MTLEAFLEPRGRAHRSSESKGSARMSEPYGGHHRSTVTSVSGWEQQVSRSPSAGGSIGAGS